VKPQTLAPPAGMNVLFAVDGSDHSVAAGRMLNFLPLPETAVLTILNVMPSDFLDIPERFVPEIEDRVKNDVAAIMTREYARAEKIIEHARESLAARFRHIEARSRVGDPSTEILKAEESTRADLIALGCRGLRGLRGTLGSVSRNVLRHAACSVLIGR